MTRRRLRVTANDFAFAAYPGSLANIPLDPTQHLFQYENLHVTTAEN